MVEFGIKLGFTGTLQGMSDAQRIAVRSIVNAVQMSITSVHHGDCIGSDWDFHRIIRQDFSNIGVCRHPPIAENYRAYCDWDWTQIPEEYLTRDREIVHHSTIMLATPFELREPTNC